MNARLSHDLKCKIGFEEYLTDKISLQHLKIKTIKIKNNLIDKNTFF